MEYEHEHPFFRAIDSNLNRCST